MTISGPWKYNRSPEHPARSLDGYVGCTVQLRNGGDSAERETEVLFSVDFGPKIDNQA